MSFDPKDPDYENRVRDSFKLQTAMETLGGEILEINPGNVILGMPFHKKLVQQHGFIHAGIITTMMDSAAGYAAYSLMPREAAVLTVEFKTNLMAPAKGSYFRFEGKVVKPGRTVTFAGAEAYAVGENGQDKLIANMNATMMTVIGRDDVQG